MAVRKRVQREGAPEKGAAVDIEMLIEKGGSIPGEEGMPKDEYKKFLVRIKIDLLAAVDEAVKRDPVISHRNTWVVNAIYERLERDGLV